MYGVVWQTGAPLWSRNANLFTGRFAKGGPVQWTPPAGHAVNFYLSWCPPHSDGYPLRFLAFDAEVSFHGDRALSAGNLVWSGDIELKEVSLIRYWSGASGGGEGRTF